VKTEHDRIVILVTDILQREKNPPFRFPTHSRPAFNTITPGQGFPSETRRETAAGAGMPSEGPPAQGPRLPPWLSAKCFAKSADQILASIARFATATLAAHAPASYTRNQ
jgi:hypothetical protein